MRIIAAPCKGWASKVGIRTENQRQPLLPLKQVYIVKRAVALQKRPYHLDSTTSRQLSEVKPDRAWLVLRWVTTWESRVLLLFCQNRS